MKRSEARANAEARRREAAGGGGADEERVVSPPDNDDGCPNDPDPAPPPPPARVGRRARSAVASPPAPPPPSPEESPAGDEAAGDDTLEAALARGALFDDMPAMPGGYGRIVERIFTVDPEADFDMLERDLKLKSKAHMADYATLVDALDATQDNARLAHRLYVNARSALEGFEIDAKVYLADMRAQAVAFLQTEKDAGRHAKAITDADVEARMASMHADEWRELATRRVQARKAVDHLERLAELWKSRCATIDTEVKTSRR